jgi:hypothetical protein
MLAYLQQKRFITPDRALVKYSYKTFFSLIINQLLFSSLAYSGFGTASAQ